MASDPITGSLDFNRILQPRRWYLLQAQWARDTFQEGLASLLYGKQQEQPGTPLPANFPFRAALIAANYTALEDITGANADELVRAVGLSGRDAATVIAAAPQPPSMVPKTF